MCLKNFSEITKDLFHTPKTSKTQEITGDDFVLIRFSAKKAEVLSVGQVEEKEAFTWEMKFMWRHVEALQFVFSDKGNMSEIEREDTVAKLPQPIPSGLCAIQL